MTGIWVNSGEGWDLGTPEMFPDEDTLHKLIAKNPQLLPLAGSPRLTVLGSEVLLGTGYADILAVEPTGRPVIIEVKLARNSEARRAIVSQVLAYAAFLHGTDVESLEQGPLRNALADAGHVSVLETVQAGDQEGAVDGESFSDALQEFLDTGNFRLVLVLDEVSAELAQIISYLDTITVQSLTIDLMTVSVFEVNGAQIALPQRVTSDFSDTVTPESLARPKRAGSRGILSDGSDAFRASVEGATGEAQKTFGELIEWAERLGDLSNVRLSTYAGVSQYSLLPRIMPDRAGLVSIWNYQNQASISVWRSVFERRAPNSIELVERAIAPARIGQGNTIYDITPQVLEALTTAYGEASGN